MITLEIKSNIERSHPQADKLQWLVRKAFKGAVINKREDELYPELDVFEVSIENENHIQYFGGMESLLNAEFDIDSDYITPSDYEIELLDSGGDDGILIDFMNRKNKLLNDKLELASLTIDVFVEDQNRLQKRIDYIESFIYSSGLIRYKPTIKAIILALSKEGIVDAEYVFKQIFTPTH